MNNELAPQVKISRPKDQSLAAYKAWILEIARRLITDKSSIDFTEAEWVANWKEFWREKYRT